MRKMTIISWPEWFDFLSEKKGIEAVEKLYKALITTWAHSIKKVLLLRRTLYIK